ncbi:recombinase family protein [Shewanella algae]|uniref:recombinase family protein n=1 Tax=Shewanella algae TaxID=38313 RepID=UPI0031F48526
MSRIGYARVSSTGQSLEVQLDKLTEAKCERIYQEKRSGRTAERPEFQACMNYLRDGDTLVITKLDRLARSVVHLAQLAKRFESEGIGLVVLDQNIDTSTSTGRLMFNMLAAIAEFENDLRTERQAEGIAKAKANGVKFGRPSKLTTHAQQVICSRRKAGDTIGQLAKAFGVGEATIYRTLNLAKTEASPLGSNTTQVQLLLEVANNGKFSKGKDLTLRHIEIYCLPHYQGKKISNLKYELTFDYIDDQDLDDQVQDLAMEINHAAEIHNGFVQFDFSEVGTGRTW